jgi:Holliday junction resolvasome RuvABC endonuclease subunit
MPILALDLSTSVGWAIFAQPDRKPMHVGTYKVAKGESQDDYGARTFDLETWLEMMIKRYMPDVIAFESPFIPMGRPAFPAGGKFGQTLDPDDKPFVTTQHTLRLQISLANTIELTAARRGIRCLEVASVSAKKALTGSGRSPKDHMIVAAKDRGWDVKNNHEADAGGVGLVAIDWIARPAAAE